MGTVGNFWGGLIAQLRAEQGLSQRQLASGARVNRATLRRVEAGLTVGDIQMVEEVLSFLGYDLEAIRVASEEEKFKRQAKLVQDPTSRSRVAVGRILHADYKG